LGRRAGGAQEKSAKGPAEGGQAKSKKQAAE